MIELDDERVDGGRDVAPVVRGGSRPEPDTMSTGQPAAAGLEEPATRVVIVEGHELLAQTLALVLGADGFDVELAGDLNLDGVVRAAGRMSPTLVLLGLDLAEHGSALPYIAPLRDLGCCVVVLTHATNQGPLGRCMAAGAVGVALTSAPLDDLIIRLKEAARRCGSPPDRHPPPGAPVPQR